ncbi:MAG: hypothetical protein HYX78_02705 [Armatimonadetes bacterium]|nr:hypothetical protein [Armatimonadota bacterium]
MGLVQDVVVRELIPHDQLVREIAELRFGLDNWEIVTNTDSRKRDGIEAALPDIVARCNSSVVALGTVETEETVSDDRATTWKTIGESCARFYLYIPEGAERETVLLIKKHRVLCAGLRSYSLNGKLEVNPVHVDGVECGEDDHPWWVALGGADNTC